MRWGWWWNIFWMKNLVAVAGNVKVGNEKIFLPSGSQLNIQLLKILIDELLILLNCITVVPGAIGAFRKSAIIAGWRIYNRYTCWRLRSNNTIAEKKRHCTQLHWSNCCNRSSGNFKTIYENNHFRWSYGIMQSFWKNKDACFNPRFGTLGIALPNLFYFRFWCPLYNYCRLDVFYKV